MKTRALLAVVGLSLILVLGAACAQADRTPVQSGTGQPQGQTQQGTGVPQGQALPGTGAPQGQTTDAGEAPGRTTLPAPSSQASGVGFASPVYYPVPSGQQAGIWVTGQARMSVLPDLALLSLGVESRGATVEAARSEAASAMSAMVNVLRARGVAERDIQTSYFNIQPVYEWQEVVDKTGIRGGKQVLVGYQVTNSAQVKIRNLNTVGALIDEVAKAGGDLVRIHGVSFTVEDPAKLQDQVREAAIKDAVKKAQQFATLTGSTLGKLIYITETGGAYPVIMREAIASKGAAADAMPPTPISAGETELSIMVQAVFAVQ